MIDKRLREEFLNNNTKYIGLSTLSRKIALAIDKNPRSFYYTVMNNVDYLLKNLDFNDFLDAFRTTQKRMGGIINDRRDE